MPLYESDAHWDEGYWGKGFKRGLVPAGAPQRGGLGLFFDGFLCLTWGGYPDTHGTMPRAMRVEFPGAIYYVMDREDRLEDIFNHDVDRQDFLKTSKDRILSEELSRRGWATDQEGHPRASRWAYKRRIRGTRAVGGCN